MPDIACDRDGDQVEAADAAVGRIEGDPAGARHIDLRPGMGRPRACRTRAVLVRIVEIAGDDPRPETETASRFGK